ncbi:hypothetical protein [Shewanella waksmanii]|uniref:hypothetical protein n=1 Tax=Shewanella waksmanii TaxID=213783 RepID=UPI003737034E
MGKSKSIAQMESREDEYRAYLAKLEKQLEDKTEQVQHMLQQSMHDYYESNNYSYSEFLSGKNADFMQESEWSLSNLKRIIDAISKAIFGESNLPSGVTIAKSEEVGKAISEMENMEVYIAGKCFEVLSGIVESFGSSSSVSYTSSFKHEPLGNGLHLFASVACDSYKSKSFFDNESVYQYLYVYNVRYSVDEAQKESQIALTELYEDQISTFKGKVEDLLKQLSDDKITPEQYESTSHIYDLLISESEKKLEELKNK